MDAGYAPQHDVYSLPGPHPPRPPRPPPLKSPPGEAGECSSRVAEDDWPKMQADILAALKAADTNAPPPPVQQISPPASAPATTPTPAAGSRLSGCHVSVRGNMPREPNPMTVV